MSLFRHSAKNFWIFLKKLLCRVPQRGTRQRNFIFFLKIFCRVPCPWHSARTPRIAKNFLHSIVTDNIYIYINHHIYITNMHYISQAHAYLINPSKIHHKCTKVQHPYCGDGDCRCGPPNYGEWPYCGEGLTRSAAGDTLAKCML